MSKMPKPKTINDLPEGVTLDCVRFIYPGDGQAYYWVSQWDKGVWGKKNPADKEMFPLQVNDLRECLKWELADE